MNTKLMTIFTRTPLHVGAGSSVGAVDSPIIRERHTQFPVIPGSAIKGVLSDLWNDEKFERTERGKKLFGNDDTSNASAGSLLIGEGKLLAFPVRSAKGCFAWITCPLALNRFLRDTGRTAVIPDVVGEKVFASDALLLGENKDKVIFEEYPLTIGGELHASIVETLKDLCGDAVWTQLAEKFAVVSDEIFAYFAKNACEIAQHNRIDDETGVVADGALFNQENVPSETLFYSIVGAKDGGDVAELSQKICEEGNLLQFGANMTTGLGWCSVVVKEVR